MRCLGCFEAVTESADSSQIPGRFRPLLDVLAQAPHVHVHRPRRDVALPAPHRIQELLAAVSAAGMSQRKKSSRLNSVEVNRSSLSSAETRRAARSSRNGPTSATGGSDFHLLAPQMGLDARYQFPEAERLGHVIVAADLQAQHAVDFVRASGKEQNRNAGQARPICESGGTTRSRPSQVAAHPAGSDPASTAPAPSAYSGAVESLRVVALR